MRNDYLLFEWIQMRHQEDIATAERWRMVHQAALAGDGLQNRRPWPARLGAWLESTGCALQARYREMAAAPGEASCAH